MPGMKTDVVVWPVVSALVDELASGFRADGIDIDRAVAQWGEAAILDIGEDECVLNQAWVRLMTQVPSMQFPAPQGSPVWGGRTGPGSPARMATTLEVGFVHCTGWQIDDQFVPSEEEYMADAERCYAEMSSVKRSICRTMANLKREYQLVAFTPLNDGISSGGTWQVAVDWVKGS